MGLLDWLIGAALSVAAAWLIAETVSYIINKKSLGQWLSEKKCSGEIDQNAVKACIKNKNGHELTFDMLDRFNTNLGSGKVASNAGISNDIRVGDVIML